MFFTNSLTADRTRTSRSDNQMLMDPKTFLIQIIERLHLALGWKFTASVWMSVWIRTRKWTYMSTHCLPCFVLKSLFIPLGVRSSPGPSVSRSVCPETVRVTALSEKLLPPCAASLCPPTPCNQRPMRTWPSLPTLATPPWPRELHLSSAAGWTSCRHRGAFESHSWSDQGCVWFAQLVSLVSLSVCLSGVRDQCWLCCCVSSSLLLPVFPPFSGAASVSSHSSSPHHPPLLPPLGVCLSFFLWSTGAFFSAGQNRCFLGLWSCDLNWCVFMFQELCFPEAFCEVWWQKPDVLWQWEGTQILCYLYGPHVITSCNRLLCPCSVASGSGSFSEPDDRITGM